jgi:hypothetical protein
MGNYNTQYQSYYNSLAKRQRDGKSFATENNKKSKRLDFFMKILIRQLIGVLVLFLFVLICKVVVTPKTQYIYNYSKEVISKQYDYGLLIDKAKTIKYKDIEIITVNFIEKIKNTISSENMINENNYNSEKL